MVLVGTTMRPGSAGIVEEEVVVVMVMVWRWAELMVPLRRWDVLYDVFYLNCKAHPQKTAHLFECIAYPHHSCRSLGKSLAGCPLPSNYSHLQLSPKRPPPPPRGRRRMRPRPPVAPQASRRSPSPVFTPMGPWHFRLRLSLSMGVDVYHRLFH